MSCKNSAKLHLRLRFVVPPQLPAQGRQSHTQQPRRATACKPFIRFAPSLFAGRLPPSAVGTFCPWRCSNADSLTAYRLTFYLRLTVSGDANACEILIIYLQVIFCFFKSRSLKLSTFEKAIYILSFYQFILNFFVFYSFIIHLI